MNAHLKPLVISLAMALSFNVMPASAGNGPGNNAGMTCISVPAGAQISESEAASLSFMREEEKLARDVYQNLYAQWQDVVFNNIATSEQTHMDQIKCLLDGYGLPDSALDEVGRFNNSDLQTLYDSLIERGQTSLIEALRVGGLIEEVDIKDLQQAISETEVVEIQMVYNNLLKGSENHLRAFTGRLEQLGETYTPQLLSAEAVSDALATAIFDLDSQTVVINELRIRQNGRLLPQTNMYQVELRMNRDGQTLQLMKVQRHNAPQ